MVVTGELTGVVSAHSQKHSHACLVFCCFTTKVTVASQSATYNATLLLVPVHGLYSLFTKVTSWTLGLP